MFTGIVEATGELLAVEDSAAGRRLRIGTDFSALEAGQSIAVDGACLTVETFESGAWFEVFLAQETLDRTTFDAVTVGDAVNLERALAADERFDGHVVQGHVDGTTTVEAVERLGDDWAYTFALPPDLARYVVEKGSIALDGISLTVASVDEPAGTFDVAIVPTTYHETTISERDPGDDVHVEVDVFAKYVERLLGLTEPDAEAADTTAVREAIGQFR